MLVLRNCRIATVTITSGFSIFWSISCGTNFTYIIRKIIRYFKRDNLYCFISFIIFILFYRCVHITDIGVGYISTMVSLSALFLRWCSQLRDFGLQHLCVMRSLQVLSVAGKIILKHIL